MRRILIYRNIDETEYAIFRKTDYRTIYQTIREERNGNWPNFANKLWLQGLVSEISTEENQIEYMTYPMDSQYVNEHFDIVIIPSANIFSPAYVDLLDKLADVFSKIHIPTYVISCGVQAQSYAGLLELIQQVGTSASRYIDAVYRTGGEFSLRGYFTKEFFDKLGFPTAVATGCPSLYQNGRNLMIEKPYLQQTELKPIINGQNYMFSTDFYHNIFREYADAVFIDQDHYGEYLYDTDTDVLDDLTLGKLLRLVKKESYLGLELLSSGRLLYFIDMPNWREYIRNEGYNFSFGGRIHGNIMSLLSGIPAAVYVCDSRTREMAEFFDIPIIEESSDKSLYEIYCSIDFARFNASFGQKYDTYEKFLVEHGIIDAKMNESNIFFNDKVLADKNAPVINNENRLKACNDQLKRNKMILQVADKTITQIRRFRK